MASSRRVIYLTVLMWRLQVVFTAFMTLAWASIAFAIMFFHGVHCARVELLPRPMAFYDKNTKRMNKNFNMTKANNLLFKGDAHLRISFTV